MRRLFALLLMLLLMVVDKDVEAKACCGYFVDCPVGHGKIIDENYDVGCDNDDDVVVVVVVCQCT